MKAAAFSFFCLLAACVHTSAETAAVETKLTGIVVVENIKLAVLNVEETDARKQTRTVCKILREGESDRPVEVVFIDGRNGSVVIQRSGQRTQLSFTPNPVLKPAAAEVGTVRFQDMPLEDLLELLPLADHRTLLRGSALPGLKFTGQREGLDAAGFAKWIEQLLRENDLILTPSGSKFMFLTQVNQTVPTPLVPDGISPAKKSYEPSALVFMNMPLEQFLEFYGDVTGLSVLRPASLPGATITIRNATALSQSELVYALDSVLKLNGIRTTPRGEKFVIVTPETAPLPKVAQLSPTTGSGSEKKYAPQALRFKAMPLDAFLNFYASVTGRPIAISPNLPRIYITVRTNSELTQTELTEALDILLALNGMQAIAGANGQWNLSPLAVTP